MIRHLFRTTVTAFVLAAALGVAGCAGNDEKPVRQFAKAEATINQAVQQGAGQRSQAALQRAENKLDRAHEAADGGDNARAERLAHEAEVDASYAIAAAETQKLQSIAETLRENLQALEEQAQTGSKGAAR